MWTKGWKIQTLINVCFSRSHKFIWNLEHQSKRLHVSSIKPPSSLFKKAWLYYEVKKIVVLLFHGYVLRYKQIVHNSPHSFVNIYFLSHPKIKKSMDKKLGWNHHPISVGFTVNEPSFTWLSCWLIVFCATL